MFTIPKKDSPESSSAPPPPPYTPQTSPQQTVTFSPSTRGLPGGDSGVQTTNIESGPAPSSSPMLALPAPDPGEQYRGPATDENEHKYVGLVNQAMTCYLNSLVQSLYMTPEFRNAIYEWEYKSQSGKGSGESSIPCQIQKLFLLLQTTERDSLETTDLTASFGWTSNEAYDQHDVQELCRLMFDALEHRWKNSKHEKLIQELYRGTMQDFVKCLNCGKENIREDFFLDLPLAVKPFGAIEAYKSVEEALVGFIQPELLDGSNQYQCENCNSKQDAHKGLRVTQFPYLLTIQLKRFDFDYTTMHRIKLNDKMTFPDVLNLNPFVHDVKHTVTKERMESIVNEAIHSRVGHPLNKAEVSALLEEGPYVYELFSVMVHQGSAAGGHYFAYIKNMVQDRWFCFNDTRVESAASSEIERSFGGSLGGWTSSNTNAYMLMYRKIDTSRNAPFVKTPELPQHIVSLQSRWKEAEAEKERQRAYEQSLVKISVELNAVCPSEEIHGDLFRLELPRTKSIGEIYNSALKYFTERCKDLGIEPPVKNQSRLILCQVNRFSAKSYKMIAEYISKNDLEKKIESISMEAKEFHFLLDARHPACKGTHRFRLSPESPRTIEVSRVDIHNRVVLPPYRVNVDPDNNVIVRMKNLIGAIFGDAPRDMFSARLLLQKHDNKSNEFLSLGPDLNAKKLDDIATVSYAAVPLFYYDGGCNPTEEIYNDRKKDLSNSIMFEILDRKKFAMVMRVQLPSDEEISRAKATSVAFEGPTWTDTMQQGTSQGSNNQNNASSSRIEEVESESGRASSSASMISDDVMLGPDSLCNNTPQLSPNVSENGDYDEGISNVDLTSRMLDIGATDYSSVYQPLKGLSSSSTNSFKHSADSESLASTIMPVNESSKKIVVLDRNDQNVYTLDVDSRVTISLFKDWLAQTMGVDNSQFVLQKHHSDDLSARCYEVSCSDDDLCDQLNNVHMISVKLRPPMKPDERLIHIILFDLEDTNKDNWKGLFDVPSSRTTLVGDLLLQCQRLYQQVYGTELDYRQIRLRDLTATRACLSPHKRLENCRPLNWTNPIYMQIITEESQIGASGEPIFVRRFRQSTVEVGPIQEVLVEPGCRGHMGADSIKDLIHAISNISGIPVERIEITEPPASQWAGGSWPFTKSRLEMLDGGVRFVKTFQFVSDLHERIGSRVIYYRDSEEKAKELTEEERKQITIKDNTSSSSNAVARRKERPLRIQMSSISEG